MNRLSAKGLAGWIVTFIMDERHGNSNSGYISSGFFGGIDISSAVFSICDHKQGLMVGRLALLWVNKKVSPSRGLIGRL